MFRLCARRTALAPDNEHSALICNHLVANNSQKLKAQNTSN